MLLSGLLIGLGVNRIINYTFLDGIMSVGPWYQRYYVGGFTRAKKGAEDKIAKERQKIMMAILSKASNQ
jgi:predicted RND superfamily exporter protein